MQEYSALYCRESEPLQENKENETKDEKIQRTVFVAMGQVSYNKIIVFLFFFSIKERGLLRNPPM